MRASFINIKVDQLSFNQLIQLKYDLVRLQAEADKHFDKLCDDRIQFTNKEAAYYKKQWKYVGSKLDWIIKYED